MLKQTLAAAFAVTLALAAGASAPAANSAPGGAFETALTPVSPMAADQLSGAANRPVAAPAATRAPAAAAAPAHEHVHAETASPSLAPGQSRADYLAWLARSPANRDAVTRFRDRLADEGVEDVVPVWQLVRTSSSFRQCAASPFEVAPADKWANIVDTLKFVRDQVVPAVGRVEALSAYRNERLNACSAGAPRSAHRMFFALDLTPVSANVSRERMIASVCRAHGAHGRAFDTGLGFYSGKRFHVDSSGYRRWGPDGSGASSPCTRYS